MLPVDRSTLSIRVTCAGPVDIATLDALDRLVAAHPDVADLAFARACLLEDLGRPLAAARAYDALLAFSPDHDGALTNAGALAFADGRPHAARAYFARAADAHPGEPRVHVNLANVLAQLDPPSSREAYARALALDPQHAIARYALGLGFVEPYVHVTPSVAADPLRILVPYAADGGNLVTTTFFDPRAVETIALAAESWDDDPLPSHDLIFNAVADADRSVAALDRVARIIARSQRPCINHPDAVRATSRATLGERVAAVEGIVVPRCLRFARPDVTAANLAAAGLTFPLLLRTPGFHAGRHFVRVHDADDVAPQLATLPGDDVFAIEFVDTRGEDERYRKYRVLAIDGTLLPLHLAASRGWKVHYFSADTSRHAPSRAAEIAFLADPQAALGAAIWHRLERVLELLALDYGGIDFALDAQGRVVVFEANASFAIYRPDGATSAYRAPAVERAIAAVRAMIDERALRGRAVREDGAFDDGEHRGPA
jgi:glutathione synthase/RimK-type ligase-like ATP-grasp enzyme